METVTIVLLALLVVFFLLFAFLAIFRDETKKYEALPLSPGSCSDDSHALTPQRLREKYLRDAALQHLAAPYHKTFSCFPPGYIEAPFSHGLPDERDMKYIDTKKQDEMTAHREIIETEGEALSARGFSSAEVVSLLRLRCWYQSGGSDRMALLRHWEFLRLLVLNGRLDV